MDNEGKNLLVIADGAAFGSEMGELFLYMQKHLEISLYLPESFEWLILQSGIVPIVGVEEMLKDPGQQIESRDFFSWERFFENYLVQQSANTYDAYSKSRLHSFYTVRENMERIVAVIVVNAPSHNAGL